MKLCTIHGCSKKHKGRGLCGMHLHRLRVHGDALKTATLPASSTSEDRLRYWGWTVTDSGCWEWLGRKDPKGYGRVPRNNTTIGAHRLAYETWVGPIPDGKVVRHRCDNPPCVNPEHLLSGTYAENSNDMVQRNRWSGNDKICLDDAEDIRWLYGHGVSALDCASAYGVSRATVYDILKRRTWTK